MTSPKTYHLDTLKHGVTLSDPESLGLECVRVKSLILHDPDTDLTIKFVGPLYNRQSVEIEIAKIFPHENPLNRKPVVIAAEIALHFFPEAGMDTGKNLVLEFDRKGHSNLDDLEEEDRLLVDKLMVEWGLVDASSPERPPNQKGGSPNDTDWNPAASGRSRPRPWRFWRKNWRLSKAAPSKTGSERATSRRFAC